MREPALEKPDYGNWVSTKLIYGPIAIGIPLLGLSLVSPILGLCALPFLLSSAYFAYARHLFSPNGGGIQTRIWDLVLDCLGWDGEGEALDIGCGNGPLAIRLARRYPTAHVTGIDYWGAAWQYSKEACERNAQIEGVAGRTVFQKASAAALPFEDASFDVAVSNFVFHSVMDTKDKRALVKEALRVVKKGGRFSFQDQFLDRALYGEVADLLEEIKSWGIQEVAFSDTSGADFLPGALKLRFMAGNMSIIYGTK
jgi:SAM-dependent methyltransferase